MNDLKLHQLKKSKDILLALKQYGVMSQKTLQTVVPDIKKERNFRIYLKSLCAKGLVVRRLDQLNGFTGVFYQLNQKPKVREVLAQYLDCNTDDLKQREFRYKELLHEQTAIKIAYYLNSNFPDALVLRDFELHRNIEARKVIPNLNQVEQPKPDVLMLIPDMSKNKIVSVAIEFERSVKQKNRILNKLKYYAADTHIDSMIYIATADRIIENLSDVYESRVLEKAVRIKHYGRNFLLTGLWKNDVDKSFQLLRNQSGIYYGLIDYVAKLRLKSARERSDIEFDVPSTVCMDKGKYDL